MGQEKVMGVVDLDKVYIRTLKECGKNPSKEMIEQEFLAELKLIGGRFLRYKLE